VGGRYVIRGDDELSAADLTSFLLYTLNLAVALGGLMELFSTFVTALGASERMFSLLDSVPSIPNRRPRGPDALTESTAVVVFGDVMGGGAGAAARNGGGGGGGHRGQVRFDAVGFSYPTRPEVEVLRGISFECAPGTVNALVGPSGGGKSTIISLILRFYDPDKGAVFVNGRNVRDVAPADLHRRMAVVSQEPALFAASIAQNLAYGLHRRPTREELEHAAKRANAYDFITGFPDGFDTLVGERGVQLSGGQKQRVAIARAMLVDPDVLLLDEATSALDSASEHLVQLALDELMRGRTTLVVAHRLSTVRNAQTIFCLDQGVVAERGSHDDLMRIPNGLYAGLVARQLKA